MSLTLLGNATSIAPGATVPFEGNGGTPPYVYSVLGGGAGGTINSSTGYYAAPLVTGSDVIRVTDALSAIATSTISIQNVLELVCNLIQTQLGLPDGQIWLWNQKVNIPIDEKLYITVGIESSRPFGNSNAPNSTNTSQIQSANICDTLSIDAMSRGPIARDQLNQIILAFESQYAEQQMELNSFKIYPVSTPFLNISGIDGAAIPYRFRNTVKVQYFVTTNSSVEYYGTFSMSTVTTNP